jgi:uncharacterized protein involved in type VI secretion and phage assembly
MVLADSPSAVQTCPVQHKAEYKGVENTHQDDLDVVRTWLSEQELRPGSWALTDFNFETPLAAVSASVDSLVKSGQGFLETNVS